MDAQLVCQELDELHVVEVGEESAQAFLLAEARAEVGRHVRPVPHAERELVQDVHAFGEELRVVAAAAVVVVDVRVVVAGRRGSRCRMTSATPARQRHGRVELLSVRVLLLMVVLLSVVVFDHGGAERFVAVLDEVDERVDELDARVGRVDEGVVGALARVVDVVELVERGEHLVRARVGQLPRLAQVQQEVDRAEEGRAPLVHVDADGGLIVDHAAAAAAAADAIPRSGELR